MIHKFISDNQPSFVSGLQNMPILMLDVELKNYFKMHNIKILDFQPYPSGASFLGGAVESMVKQVKHIIVAGTSNKEVSLREFEFLVAKAKALINKRPIGFKSMLRANESDPELQFVITPELLLKGYEVPSINVLPCLDISDQIDDLDWQLNTNEPFELFKSMGIIL